MTVKNTKTVCAGGGGGSNTNIIHDILNGSNLSLKKDMHNYVLFIVSNEIGKYFC